MKTRKCEYGNCNMIGRNAERIRREKEIKQKDFVIRLQNEGLPINPTSYSKLEGQLRLATDKETFCIARALEIPVEELFVAVNTGEETDVEN